MKHDVLEAGLSAQDTAASPRDRLRTAAPWLFWAYSLVLIGLRSIGTVVAPGKADSQLFAYIGREWARGVALYSQIWDDKPPGIFVINRLAAAAHRQFLALAVMEFLALALTLFLVAKIAEEIGCRESVRWSAPLMAASAFSVSAYSLGGNYTELYVLPFAAFSIYAFLRGWRWERGGLWWLAAGGASAGIAAAFKPVGMAPLLAFSAALLVWRPRTLKRNGSAAALAWAGLVFVWACIEGAFARTGAAGLMTYASITYNLHYGASGPSPAMRIFLTVDRMMLVGALAGCAAAAVVLGAVPSIGVRRGRQPARARRDAAILFLLWIAADLCGANAGGRFYPHYFLPALLSTTVLACLGLDEILGLMDSSPAGVRRITGMALLVPIALMGVKGLLDEYHSLAGNETESWARAAVFVRDHRGPQDTLFTWEFVPGVYGIAATHTTTRWASAHYIDDFSGAYATIGNELMQELSAAPPTFILHECGLKPRNSRDTVRAAFLRLLATKYRIVDREGDTCVEERLSAAD